MNFTAEHKILIEQFRNHDGEHLSADALQRLTNIEPIKISAIIADLVAHGLILRQTNGDESGVGWQYILSDDGRKFVREHGG